MTIHERGFAVPRCCKPPLVSQTTVICRTASVCALVSSGQVRIGKLALIKAPLEGLARRVACFLCSLPLYLLVMSTQELELAIVYAYNPPGVGEEAALLKAQVNNEAASTAHNREQSSCSKVRCCVWPFSAHATVRSRCLAGYIYILWASSLLQSGKVFGTQLATKV